MKKMLQSSYLQGAMLLALMGLSLNAEAQQARAKRIEADLLKNKKVESVSMDERKGTLKMVTFKKEESANLDKTKIPSLINEVVKKNLLAKDLTNFQFKRHDASPDGWDIVRYQQYFKGIRVEHGVTVISTLNGKVLDMNNDLYDLDPSTSTTPKLSEQVALQYALDFLKANLYSWDEIAQAIPNAKDAEMRKALEKAYLDYLPKSELTFVKDFFEDGTEARLAYRFDISYTKPIGRDYVYVDAQNGKILLKNPVIKHAHWTYDNPNELYYAEQKVQESESKELSGLEEIKLIADAQKAQMKSMATSALGFQRTVGQTRYAGDQEFPTSDITKSTFKLYYLNGQTTNNVIADPGVPEKDVPARGAITATVKIETYDLNTAGGAPVSTPIYDLPTSKIINNHSNALGTDTTIVTAAQPNDWRIARTRRSPSDPMANKTYGNSGDNDDVAVDAHWGAEEVVKYWAETHGRNSWGNEGEAVKSYVHCGTGYDNAFWNGSVMTYGDGQSFRPLTSLDVCAHEIGHAVCSGTSDLVYALESGAMNEALSDCWAAAVEQYVLDKTTDPTKKAFLLKSLKPYGIGEQIETGNADYNNINGDGPTDYSGLRRMDYPATAAGGNNPDYYGGRYWQSTVNCTPTLANDQCGVHGNSGVLNRWYYAMTQSAPVDVTATRSATLNTPFLQVGGLGYTRASAILYAMERRLTPTATYAEARTVCMSYIAQTYGSCGFEFVQAEKAWQAIGVGGLSDCQVTGIPVVDFGTSYRLLALNETGDTTPVGACIAQRIVPVKVNMPIVALTPVVVNFTATGTATQGTSGDYSLSASSVTYAVGERGLKTINLIINDDNLVETGLDSVYLTFTVTGGGVAGSNRDTIMIRDNDVEPVVAAGALNLLALQNFTASAGQLPANWRSFTPGTGAATMRWQVGASTQAGAPTSNVAVVGTIANNPNRNDVYDVNTAAEAILVGPLVDARGVKNLKLNFKWWAVGENDGSPACGCDAGNLVYSFDNVNFVEMPGGPILQGGAVPIGASTPASATVTNFALPAVLEGKLFYIGFRWKNDALVGSAVSLAIDDVSITGAAKAIASSIVSSKAPLGANQTVFYYGGGEIIAKIKNNTTFDYGCTTVEIDRAGTTAQSYRGNSGNANKVMDKTFKVTPTNANPAGNYDVTLYLNDNEVSGWETATGKTFANDAMIHKTSVAAPSATSADAVTSAQTSRGALAAPSTAGKQITATFTNGFSGFAIGTPEAVLAAELVSFKAVAGTNSINLKWESVAEINLNGYEVERNTANGFEKISFVKGKGAAEYTFEDKNVVANTVYSYRLKMVDNDATTKFSDIASASINGKGLQVSVFPTLTTGSTKVQVLGTSGKTIFSISDASGRIVKNGQLTTTNGIAEQQIDLSNMASGIYMIKVEADGLENVSKITLQRP